VDPIIEQVVSRCHVGESNRAVIKYVISRLKCGRRTWTKLPRTIRRAAMLQAIAVHRANRQLYSDVMTGRL